MDRVKNFPPENFFHTAYFFIDHICKHGEFYSGVFQECSQDRFASVLEKIRHANIDLLINTAKNYAEYVETKMEEIEQVREEHNGLKFSEIKKFDLDLGNSIFALDMLFKHKFSFNSIRYCSKPCFCGRYASKQALFTIDSKNEVFHICIECLKMFPTMEFEKWMEPLMDCLNCKKLGYPTMELLEDAQSRLSLPAEQIDYLKNVVISLDSHATEISHFPLKAIDSILFSFDLIVCYLSGDIIDSIREKYASLVSRYLSMAIEESSSLTEYEQDYFILIEMVADKMKDISSGALKSFLSKRFNSYVLDTTDCWKRWSVEKSTEPLATSINNAKMSKEYEKSYKKILNEKKSHLNEEVIETRNKLERAFIRAQGKEDCVFSRAIIGYGTNQEEDEELLMGKYYFTMKNQIKRGDSIKKRFNFKEKFPNYSVVADTGMAKIIFEKSDKKEKKPYFNPMIKRVTNNYPTTEGKGTKRKTSGSKNVSDLAEEREERTAQDLFDEERSEDESEAEDLTDFITKTVEYSDVRDVLPGDESEEEETELVITKKKKLIRSSELPQSQPPGSIDDELESLL